MKKYLLTLIAILFFAKAYPWGTDVLMGPLPSGKISMVSNAAGILYCSIPSNSTAQGGVGMYQSTDLGLSWSWIANPAMGSVVLKSKLVVTGTDSVYCIYQVGSDVFVYSFTAHVTTPFTLMSVDDFDVVASPNGNAIYIYCDDAGSGNIHRYSSTDGGYTWTGSTALVAGTSGHPRLYMTGTRLILIYYSPLIADTTASIIRAAYYTESAPGTISPGTFQDLTLSGVHRGEFGSVIINNNVWAIFTEGDSVQTIKYRLSTDNGLTYGTEQILAGNTNINAQCFDAIHYLDGTGAGLRIVYYTDSLQTTKQFQYATASTLNPTTFSAPEPVSDLSAVCGGEWSYPSLVNMTADIGVIWVETDAGITETYFDKRSATVAVEEIVSALEVNIYPNPSSGFLNIRRKTNIQSELFYITDSSGRLLRKFELNLPLLQIDIRDFVPGIYFIHQHGGATIKLMKQ